MIGFIILMVFTYLFLAGAVGRAMSITLSSPAAEIFFALFWIFFIPVILGTLVVDWGISKWKK